MTPLAVTAHTATSALGRGLAAQLDALRSARSGLRPNDFGSVPLACWIGRVEGVESAPLPAALAPWDCRNNRLAWLGLNQDGFLDRVHAARTRYGASRVALLLVPSTASQKNDEVEAALVGRAFPVSTRASSTKGFTGHTLGAAGIVEATMALQAIEHDLVPGNLGGDAPDPICGAQFAWRNEERRIDVALSNSFGFGGNNACLAFARAGFAA
jgi:3-oxoacyl-(acyl-carrier-protein) synthase